MDPNKTWECIQSHLGSIDFSAYELLNWVRNDGFLPESWEGTREELIHYLSDLQRL